MMDYREILTLEPGKRRGKPCIRGMRITADDVLSYLASGMTPAGIVSDFPYLTEEDIRGCLTYAADQGRQIRWSGDPALGTRQFPPFSGG